MRALFCFERSAYDHYSEREYRFRAVSGQAGRNGKRIPHCGKRRHHRRVSRSAGAVCRGRRGGLRGRADRPVLCGSAPPRPPVPHAGHGHGSAPAGLAQRLRLSHGGPLCRPGLRPDGIPPAGAGAGCPRHHAGVYVLLPPYRRHADPDGGAGAGGDHRLCG